MTEMLYRCGYDDCSSYGVPRSIMEEDAALAPDDVRRRCEGSVLVEGLVDGEPTHELAQCFRPLDRLPDGVDGAPEHVETARPVPELPPQPDLSPWQWSEVFRVSEAQLTQTDWVMNHPSDLPQTVIDEVAANQQAWLDWRHAIRDLPSYAAVDATTLVWPWPPPPSPTTAVTEPPDFVLPGELVQALADPWEASNPSIVLTPDGVQFGPYADGGADGGTLRYHGLDGQPFSVVEELHYTMWHDADDVPDVLGSAPYARVFVTDSGGGEHFAVFQPDQQPVPDIQQGLWQTWDAVAGTWRWDDDQGVTPTFTFAELQAQYGDLLIEKITVTLGFTGGTNLRGLVHSERVNGEAFVFAGTGAVKVGEKDGRD